VQGGTAASARTVTDRGTYVVEAELVLADDLDPAAVGAAVTVDLLGHWEHASPCRWPHNSVIDAGRDPGRRAAGTRRSRQPALRATTRAYSAS
jgi:hypothetical protein